MHCVRRRSEHLRESGGVLFQENKRIRRPVGSTGPLPMPQDALFISGSSRDRANQEVQCSMSGLDGAAQTEQSQQCGSKGLEMNVCCYLARSGL
jgi:hypothetical protein